MITKCTYTLLVAVFLMACGKKTSETTTESIAEQEPVVQGLTPELKAQGWKLLFDGESLNGWRFYKNKENMHWEVVDGMLHCKARQEGETNADIMTVDQYTNFELAFEWKMTPQGNSGVMFRVTETADEPYYTGPEYQLIDDNGWADPLKEEQMSGANYDMYAVAAKTVKAVGEWNASRIVVNGTHVEHWLNGEKVVEYEIGSDDWKQRKENSKWKEVEGYGIQPTGHIDFQDHDHEAWFRNIMVKPL